MKRLALLLSIALGTGAWAALPEKPAWLPWNGTDAAPTVRLIWFGGYPGLPGSYLTMTQRVANNVNSARIILYEKGAQGFTTRDFLTLTVDGLSTNNETGLLGLAFHPRFAENRRYFIYYIPPADNGQLYSIIEERTASADFRKDAGAPGKVILKVPQPKNDHNGGTLQFGPADGYLYIGFGDGGWNATNPDPFRNGQNLASPLAKVLRIDVDRAEGGLAYAIPADNPFANASGTARRETWAYGLRNPWRFSFDALAPHDLWLGDVGHNNAEEVNRIRPGLNYGWSTMEGNQCMAVVKGAKPPACDTAGLAKPVLIFDHTASSDAAVIGGYVYRGNPASPFYGVYLFADYTSGHLYAMRPRGDSLPEWKDYGIGPAKIVSFGTDPQGNIFVVGWKSGNAGVIYRLDLGEPATGIGGPAVAEGPFQGLRVLRESAGLRVQANLPGPQRLVFLLPDGRQAASLDFQGPTVLRIPPSPLLSGKVLVSWERKGLSLRRAWAL